MFDRIPYQDRCWLGHHRCWKWLSSPLLLWSRHQDLITISASKHSYENTMLHLNRFKNILWRTFQNLVLQLRLHEEKLTSWFCHLKFNLSAQPGAFGIEISFLFLRDKNERPEQKNGWCEQKSCSIHIVEYWKCLKRTSFMPDSNTRMRSSGTPKTFLNR